MFLPVCLFTIISLYHRSSPHTYTNKNLKQITNMNILHCSILQRERLISHQKELVFRGRPKWCLIEVGREALKLRHGRFFLGKVMFCNEPCETRIRCQLATWWKVGDKLEIYSLFALFDALIKQKSSSSPFINLLHAWTLLLILWLPLKPLWDTHRSSSWVHESINVEEYDRVDSTSFADANFFVFHLMLTWYLWRPIPIHSIIFHMMTSIAICITHKCRNASQTRHEVLF